MIFLLAEAPFCCLFCFFLLQSSIAAVEVDFPPLIDSEDIAYFFESNDLDGLHWALSSIFARSDRNPDTSAIVNQLPEQLVSRGGGSSYTTAYKIVHDLEQAKYLAENLQDKEKAVFFGEVVAPIYQEMLARIPPLDKLERTQGLYPFKNEDYELGIGAIYNKAKSQGVVVIDNLLNPLALARIRQLMLESTVWYQTKTPKKFGGYLGAYLDDGLHDRILLQLAFELYTKLPKILVGNFLKYMWAYKYDSQYSGIKTHADQAAVNVNIWITPDDANMDPSSGGLVVFTAKPPDDWDFKKFNTDTEFVYETLLRPTGFSNVTISHRQNRAVIFDSALFHHTDQYSFKKGYKNRRINLTILYGEMREPSPARGGEMDEL